MDVVNMMIVAYIVITCAIVVTYFVVLILICLGFIKEQPIYTNYKPTIYMSDSYSNNELRKQTEILRRNRVEAYTRQEPPKWGNNDKTWRS